MPILPIPIPTTASVNFELRKSIGSGGEAEVFLAYDSQLNAEIAIKRIPVNSFTDLSRYFVESQKLYLTRHHNIVEILYGGQDKDFVYLAMPYYSKGSIQELINSRFLTSREIIRYSLQFLSGLNNVHSKGLIHFDIKCENILISNKNHALLSDFGVAEYTSKYGFSSISATTRVFAPPEYFSQTNHNLLFDIYQAGFTIYRMAVGDESLKIQIAKYDKGSGFDQPKFLSDLAKGHFPDRTYPNHIPIALRKIINKALEPDIIKRYNSVIDILNDLSKIAQAHDWQYSRNSADNEKWEFDSHVIEAVMKNNEWHIEAKKNNRRSTAFCQRGLTDAKKNALIYKGLMEGL